MTGDLVTELQGLGYELTLDGVSLRFRYTGEDDPPEQAATLLEEVKKHKAEVLAYLRMIETPQTKLEKPFLIESRYLKDRFYLVGNEKQAGEIEQGGGVAYLPGEIRALLANSVGMDEGALADILGKIDVVKRTFPGSRIQDEGR